MKKTRYKIRSEVWLYPGMAGWHFVSLSKKISVEIRKNFGTMAKGWGSIPVEVTLGKSVWSTSIFPDKKSSTYLMPLKATIRKKEGVFQGDNISFNIDIKI